MEKERTHNANNNISTSSETKHHIIETESEVEAQARFIITF